MGDFRLSAAILALWLLLAAAWAVWGAADGAMGAAAEDASARRESRDDW